MTAVMNMTIAGALTMVLIPDPRDILHIMGSISKHKATFYPGRADDLRAHQQPSPGQRV